MTEDCRQAFEEWLASSPRLPIRYTKEVLEIAFQAGRASIPATEVTGESLERMIEAIAEEVALFERGSRGTIGHHIKRALLSELPAIQAALGGSHDKQ